MALGKNSKLNIDFEHGSKLAPFRYKIYRRLKKTNMTDGGGRAYLAKFYFDGNIIL
jgi:hypothetical protein